MVAKSWLEVCRQIGLPLHLKYWARVMVQHSEMGGIVESMLKYTPNIFALKPWEKASSAMPQQLKMKEGQEVMSEDSLLALRKEMHNLGVCSSLPLSLSECSIQCQDSSLSQFVPVEDWRVASSQISPTYLVQAWRTVQRVPASDAAAAAIDTREAGSRRWCALPQMVFLCW